MNNFKTNINGGLPFRLDDLRFINAAQMEALVGVVKAIIGDLPYAILQGCEFSVNPDYSYHINEGYVYFDNEIFYAPAQDMPSKQNGGYFWEVNITFDHTGDKAFYVDGTVHSTYEIRRATLKHYEAGEQGSRPPMQCDNTITILKNRLGVDSNPQWYEVDLSASNVSIQTAGSISAISGKLRYKIIGKTIFINLNLNLTVASSDSYSQEIRILFPTSTIQPKDTSGLISSIVFDTATSESAVFRIYRLSAIFDNNYLSIESIIPAEPFPQRAYQFSGEIFYEID